MFIKENVNPKKKVTGDCVIRAISKAEGKEWLTVFDSLVAISREIFSVPNYKDTIVRYLSKYPKIDVMHMVGDKRKRYTVNDVSKWSGTYLIDVANHMTMTCNGNNYDTWDCGNKCAYRIWKVK